jgi:hypothetical protein
LILAGGQHILVGVKAKWGLVPAVIRSPSRLQKQKLQKLARRIDALADKDRTVVQRAGEIRSLRRQAALDLHGICADFVRALNGLLAHTALDLDPGEYQPETVPENSMQLFQINARGRIVQIKFEATPELVSTENFRVPYILEGSIRCFNQQLLEQDLIEEQLLFYTIEKTRTLWRFFDARTYRSGKFDVDYLISLMEQLV